MKKSQWAVLAVLLLAVSASVAVRQTLFSDEAIAEVINETPYKAISDSVEEDSKELMELIQNTKESDGSADSIQEADNPSAGIEPDLPVNPDAGREEPGEGSAEAEQMTVMEILPPYEEGLAFLRNLAVEKLDQLIQNLLVEYAAMDPEEREQLASKTALAAKYIALAKDLEGRIDDLFYHMMDQLEMELAANGQCVETVVELTRQYEDEKELRRNEILKKAMDAQSN